MNAPTKSKRAAGLLSFLFPGLGHLYAGAMQRGLFFMLLFIGNIFGVVLVSIHGVVPLIVLLSVLLPVVYFYALFDALHAIERAKAAPERRFEPSGAAGTLPSETGKPNLGSAVPIAIGGLVVFAILSSDGSDWTDRFVEIDLSLIVAAAFITTGVVMLMTGTGRK
ncbi:DUF6677 family protein [Paenibacillus sp.]|uniref:DUF6677 family protein n=1 Tax=Paenibacillus sp. TaxID=58172 RepID=UPI002D340567|nr:DUF6677 family protein [Paenibacillus sp.]HZG86520.1 DUF6677 family protein [Paenibacillus sp.]